MDRFAFKGVSVFEGMDGMSFPWMVVRSQLSGLGFEVWVPLQLVAWVR